MRFPRNPFLRFQIARRKKDQKKIAKREFFKMLFLFLRPKLSQSTTIFHHGKAVSGFDKKPRLSEKHFSNELKA